MNGNVYSDTAINKLVAINNTVELIEETVHPKLDDIEMVNDHNHDYDHDYDYDNDELHVLSSASIHNSDNEDKSDNDNDIENYRMYITLMRCSSSFSHI